LTEFFKTFPDLFGGPGLALVAFVDSSFLTLPEVNDALVVWLTLLHPQWWAYYAAVTTVGSVAGSYALFVVGRRGGEALLRRRLKRAQLERGLAVFRRYGALAIIVPSLLPPPMPFKIFVLLSGVAGMPTATFLSLVAVGRMIRYSGWALLAYFYGEAAVAYARDHVTLLAVGLAVAAVAAAVGIFVWRRRQPA
jgi:membrane protein YqaA with SNARE-associated domain